MASVTDGARRRRLPSFHCGLLVAAAALVAVAAAIGAIEAIAGSGGSGALAVAGAGGLLLLVVVPVLGYGRDRREDIEGDSA